MQLEELEPPADRTVSVPYIILPTQDRYTSTTEFYRGVIERADRKFRFYFACGSDDQEMLDFVREYGAVGEILRVVQLTDWLIFVIIVPMCFITSNTILVCTATRGPIATAPCRIAPRRW